MYKIDNFLAILIFLIISFLCFKFNFKLEKQDVSSIISFLSIYFGFLITSFSIMINSDEVKKLNTKKDPEDNSLTLLYRLGNYYKFAIFSSLFTIIFLLLVSALNILNLTSFIIPGFIVFLLFPVKEIFNILFNLFTNKKII